MPNLNTVRTIAVRYATEGEQQARASLAGVAASYDKLGASAADVVKVTDTSSKRMLSLAGSFERAARAADPLYNAFAKASAQAALLDKGLQQGLGTTRQFAVLQEAHAKAVERLAGANDNLARGTTALGNAQKAHAGSMGSAAASGAELVHVLKAIGDETAAGVPLTRALQVESGRLFQIFTSGGIGGAISTVASKFSFLANPLVVLTAGTAALGAAALYAASSYKTMNEEMERSLRGVGAFSGLNPESLNGLAKRAAPSAGLSFGQSRDAAETITAGGRLDADNTSRVIGLVRGYAGAFGTTYGDAGKALADIFADPVRGVDKLNQRLGFLTAGTRSYIETLVHQGDTQGAIRVAMDASSVALNTQAEKVTGLAKIMRDASVDAERFRDAMGKFVFGPSDPLEKMREAEATLAARPDPAVLEQARRSADAFRRNPEAARGRAMLGMGDKPVGVAYDPATDPANIAEDMRHSEELRRSQAAEIEAGRRSLSALDIARSTAPEMDELQKLRDSYENLSKSLGDPAVVKSLGDQAGLAFAALDKLRVGVSTFATAAEKMRQDSTWHVAAIGAEDAAGKLAIESQAAYAKTLRDTHDAAQAAAASETMRAEAIANAAKRISDATDALDRQTSLIGLKPYQRLAAEAQNRLDDFKRDNTFGGFSPTASAGTPMTAGGAAYGQAPATIQAMVSAAAARTAQDPNIIAAIGKVENGFKLTGGTTMLGADGRPSSAYGFGQLTNGAAADVARAVPGFNKYDPNTAVFGAAEYLKILRDRNGGDLTAALRAYGGTPDYPDKVMRASGSAFAQAASASAGAPVAGTDLGAYTTASNANLARGQAELATGPFTSAREEIDRLKDSVAAQMDAFGKTGNELAAYNERVKILNQLQSSGVPITDALRSQAAALGQEYANASKPLDDLRKAHEQLVQSMDDVRSAGRGFLDPLLQAGVHGTSMLAALKSGLESVSSKLLSRAEDSFLDLAFGKAGTTGAGSPLGGIFSSLFSTGSAAAGVPSIPLGQGGIGHFADGGYTGPGAKYQPAGIVHAGEYVMDAASVNRIGLGALDAMRAGTRGYADGGYVPIPDGRRAPVQYAGSGGDTNIGGDTYQIDARGSTLSHQEMRSVLTQAIAANNRDRDRGFADKQRSVSQRAG